MTKPGYLNLKVNVNNRDVYIAQICDRLGIPYNVNAAIDFALKLAVFSTTTQPTSFAPDKSGAGSAAPAFTSTLSATAPEAEQ